MKLYLAIWQTQSDGIVIIDDNNYITYIDIDVKY